MTETIEDMMERHRRAMIEDAKIIADLRTQLDELTAAFYSVAFSTAIIMASIAAAALAVWFSI